MYPRNSRLNRQAFRILVVALIWASPILPAGSTIGATAYTGEPQLAFPGAAGFGAHARGGRGGRVIADAVQKAGYKTTASNFRPIVNNTLTKDERFKKVERGKYVLA